MNDLIQNAYGHLEQAADDLCSARNALERLTVHGTGQRNIETLAALQLMRELHIAASELRSRLAMIVS